MTGIPLAPFKLVPVPSDRAWFDPKLMMASTEWRQSDVPLANNVVTQVIAASPVRIMLGFAFYKLGSPDLEISPWPDWATFQGWILASNRSLWFTLFENGQLVNQAWYTNSVGADSFVRVIEILRR